ncbi:putative butyrate kinase 3 domain protein [Clostridioides difficile CD43]|nr:putative butyrate kinase 3 domain protein [Clostridioides difficile]EQE53122.1 putative butyrate kinase 3 domain protein [Clostridioides difficile CD43]
MVVKGVAEKVSYLAPIEIVPGEMEMEALALGALRVLNGEEIAKTY